MKKLILVMMLVAATMSVSAQRLWKVTGNGAKGESYLFGTHHVAPVSTLDSTPGFNSALDNVDAVYGEVVMNEADSLQMQQLMMSYMMAPADSTLSAVLTPEQLDSVNSVLAKYTMGMVSVQQLDALKPVAVNTQLALMQTMLAFPDYNPAMQIDQTVQTRAKEASKPNRGLETVEDQLKFLMGDPISVQAADLMETVAKDQKAVEFAQKLADAYNAGNLDEIQNLMLDPEMGLDEDAAERLLYKRNRAWIETLNGVLPQESVLVAVGVGHLVGDKGLIAELRKKGYTVTPVK